MVGSGAVRVSSILVVSYRNHFLLVSSGGLCKVLPTHLCRGSFGQ